MCSYERASLRSWRYCVGTRLKFWRQSRVPKKGSRDEATLRKSSNPPPPTFQVKALLSEHLSWNDHLLWATATTFRGWRCNKFALFLTSCKRRLDAWSYLYIFCVQHATKNLINNVELDIVNPNRHDRKRTALLTVAFRKPRSFSQLPYKLCIFTFP